MKSCKYVLLLTASIVSLVHSKITFNELISSDSHTPTMQQLIEHPYVQITVNKQSQQISKKFKILYSKLIISHKNKRSGYEQFIKVYHSIKQKLVEYGSLPNSNSMVDTSIQTRFLAAKRKWQFSKFFIVLLKRENSKRISSMLKKYKATYLTEKPVIRYLSEKYIAVQAFILAKDQLEDYLKHEFRGANLVIKETESIEILGDDLIHEERIEDEIEYQENNIYPRVTSHCQLNDHKQDEHPNTIIRKQVQMKVKFKVGVLDEHDENREENGDERQNEQEVEDYEQQFQL